MAISLIDRSCRICLWILTDQRLVRKSIYGWRIQSQTTHMHKSSWRYIKSPWMDNNKWFVKFKKMLIVLHWRKKISTIKEKVWRVIIISTSWRRNEAPLIVQVCHYLLDTNRRRQVKMTKFTNYKMEGIPTFESDYSLCDTLVKEGSYTQLILNSFMWG